MRTYWNQWNQEWENDDTPRYSVVHKGTYYSEELIEDKYYSYGYENFDSAMMEYNGLLAAGVPSVYIKDNEYDVYFEDGEWR